MQASFIVVFIKIKLLKGFLCLEFFFSKMDEIQKHFINKILHFLFQQNRILIKKNIFCFTHKKEKVNQNHSSIIFIVKMTFRLKCCPQNDQVMIVFTKPNLQLTKEGGVRCRQNNLNQIKSKYSVGRFQFIPEFHLKKKKKSVKTFLKYK